MVLAKTPTSSTARRTTALALTAALLLRIAVPAGLMPAEDGWFLKICPDGLPAKVAAIFGDEHAHHHQDTQESITQCDLTGLTTYDIAVATNVAETFESTNQTAAFPAFAPQHTHRTWQLKPARAPPSFPRLT